MYRGTTAIASLALATLAVGGCTNYYAIDDPSTGRTYYTTRYHAHGFGVRG